MTAAHVIYNVLKADFLERIRKKSFWIVAIISLFALYLVFPSLDTGYYTLKFDRYRGVYNSAWIGNLGALYTTYFLSFFGFFLIKNSLERDFRTGVIQIIETSKTGEIIYVVGKFLSNFVLLALLVFIIALDSILVQFLVGESNVIDLWKLLSPYLFVAIPTMAVVAGIAILFEAIPKMRGVLGNIVYFILCLGSSTAVIESQYLKVKTDGLSRPVFDYFGLTMPLKSMYKSVESYAPHFSNQVEALGGTSEYMTLKTFVWNGYEWTATMIMERFVWFGIALLIAIAAAFVLMRFKLAQDAGGKKPVTVEEDPIIKNADPVKNSFTFDEGLFGFKFHNLLKQELKLLLKGLPWWWLAISILLNLVCITQRTSVIRDSYWPFAAFWAIAAWASLGTLETVNNTQLLIFSGPKSLVRQFPAVWMAGVIISLMTGFGVALNLTISGEWKLLLSWVVACMFIPSLAMTLGIWTGTARPFIAIFGLVWYYTQIKRWHLYLDFFGTSNFSQNKGLPLFYLAATVILIAVAIYKRRRQTYMQ